VTRSYPGPVIKWRLGNTDLSYYAITISETNAEKTKTTHSSLTYTPTNNDVGKTVYCDVQHSLTNTNLTTSLALTVYRKFSLEFKMNASNL